MSLKYSARTLVRSPLLLAFLLFGLVSSGRAAGAATSQAQPTGGNKSLVAPKRVAVIPLVVKGHEVPSSDILSAVPGMVRLYLLSVESNLEIVKSSELEQLAKTKLWPPKGAVDDSVLTEVSQLLRADTIVWGELERHDRQYQIRVRVHPVLDPSTSASFVVEGENWPEWIEPVALKVASELGVEVDEETRRRWNRGWQIPVEESMLFAHTIATQSAPGGGQNPALDDLYRGLAERHPAAAIFHRLRCVALVERNESEALMKAASRFAEQCPENCDAISFLMLGKARTSDYPDAERLADGAKALKMHPGCRFVLIQLAAALGHGDKVGQLRELMESQLQLKPNDALIRALAARCRAVAGDHAASRQLLEPFLLPPDCGPLLTTFWIEVAADERRADLLGALFRTLGPEVSKNPVITELMPEVILQPSSNSIALVPRLPRVFSKGELDSELSKVLSPQEKAVLTNPFEITPKLEQEARRLAGGFTNELYQVLALFGEAGRETRALRDTKVTSGSDALDQFKDSNLRFLCEARATLFVSLARAVGLKAWMVHVDRDYEGQPAFHDCAVVWLKQGPLFVDPTLHGLDIPHQEMTVLDDLQAISHQAMQSIGDRPTLALLEGGLKLNPTNHWTRISYIIGMANLHEFSRASNELARLRSEPEEASKWDTLMASASIAMSREDWRGARAELEKAVAANPHYSRLHRHLAWVYSQLRNEAKVSEHLQLALRWNRGDLDLNFVKQADSMVRIFRAESVAKASGSADIETLRSRAQADDSDAQLALAKALLSPRSSPDQKREGMSWLEKLAKKGDSLGQTLYAEELLSQRPEGFLASAKRWLTEAAEHGAVPAQAMLAEVQYDRKWGAPNLVEAAKWALIAKQADHREAAALAREMELFLSANELQEAKKLAAQFVPKSGSPSKPAK